jgi:hypothetical protein
MTPKTRKRRRAEKVERRRRGSLRVRIRVDTRRLLRDCRRVARGIEQFGRALEASTFSFNSWSAAITNAADEMQKGTDALEVER